MKLAPFLIVDQLSKTYPTAGGSLTVLKDASFTVEAGESLAIVGPSGSGKTTLLGLCAGLDEPSTGSVTIGGRTLKGLSEDERALFRNAQIGFVFQNFQLIPTLTALENVLVPLELRGGRVEEKIGIEWLERTGLADRRHHYPIQLSGGEQQRIALARAFVHEPKLLFCDEPTGNLDGDTANTMVELIFNLVREQQSTLVLVTHDLELAHRCDTLLRLKGGQIVGREGKGESHPRTQAAVASPQQHALSETHKNRTEKSGPPACEDKSGTDIAEESPTAKAKGEKK